MNESALRRGLPEPSLGSGRTSGTPRHPSLIHPILSKRVCFYKSGDAQFNGLRLVVNSRTFKTFDALLDSLSKKVPLPFGVRNITTPRGVHAVRTLDELEDGKSYICSDTRKVKPINLAVARRKPAPWYHARPVSPRRRTAQQARGGRKQEAASARAPRVLAVFRNGDPGTKHSVVLHKRTTPTFESVLEHISELMQFHVVKLHAADGRRVDGFPGLILCSGTVVAAGREPFRPANYNAQISPAQSTLPTNRMGPRRLRALKRKRKSKPYTPKSRNFSLSSERYIVNRIQSSIAGGSCDRPSRSVELESGGHALESVAETPDTGLCVAAGGRDGRRLPSDDDIEKSFRVNQDGSMTVEMRVRLTIKEEETIHWTTTLARSSAASRLDVTCSPETGPEQEIDSVKSNSLDLGSPASSTDTITKGKTQDDDDEDPPPPLGSGVFSESNNEGGGSKVRTSAASPRSPPTPGREHIRKKQASVESVQSVAAQGGTVGSYSELTQNSNVVQQKSGRPVPKPRRQSSVEANHVNGRNVSAFTSAATAEIQRMEPSGGEVSETVSRAFEQQTRQDHFFASLCSQDMSAFGIPFCRPATSETGQLSSSEEFEPPPWRPSTASESIGVWRAEGTSATSALNSPSLGTGAIQAAGAQQQQQQRQREGSNNKRVSSKPKVINKRVRRLKLPGKKRRENSAGVPEKNRKVNIFSSAGFIKRIYGNKSKSVKSTMKLKKGPAPNGDRGVTTGSSQQSGDTLKPILKDLNIPLALKETASETVSSEKGRLNVAPVEVSRPGGTPEWQTSTHQQEKKENESCDVSERMSLPAFNSSSAVTIEYVENWLEKACPNPSAHPHEESKMMEALAFVQTENARCVESEKKTVLTTVAHDEKCSEDTSGEPLDASVRQRIRSFESKPSSQSMKKATVKQQIVYSHETATNRENSHDLARINTELKDVKPLVCSEIVPPINGTSAEITPGSRVDNEIQISFKKEAASKARSKELPTPVPDATDVPNTEHSMMGECSEAPRPGSQTPLTHPLSVNHTSDEAESPSDHTVEMTTSTRPDTSTRSAAPLPRTPSIKRAPLVSNKSLDRKMSLRKACLEKYTLCGDATSETSTSSTPIDSVGDNVLPSGICPTGTQRPSEGRAEETQQPHSISDVKRSLSCTSASPASLTSEERMSSFSISSSLAPTPTDLLPKGTKTHLFHQKEAMSPKPSVKSVKHMGSPSPGGKSQTKKSPSEPQNSPKLSSLHYRSPDTGLQRLATPNAGNSTERKLNRPKSHKRRSPYSKSLDMGSSPVRHRAGGRRRHKTPRTMNPAAELEKTATRSALTSLDVDPHVESKTADEESVTQTVAQQLDIVKKQPNMKPVLEKICYSIKVIRRTAQSKRPSCLEKSNSLPDFSSHVASAFGSSSQSLLAFLSVMTLKAGLDDVNMDKLDANNVSCAEALKMIDSLREIASIDDSHELQASLSSLQRSASKQLLQSWKGFQDLSEKYRSPTPSDSEAGVEVEAVSEKGCRIEENVVDSLDVPERLKEELSCLSKVKVYSDDEEPAERAKTKNDSNAEISKFSTEHAFDVSNDEKADVDVSSIIKKFTDINQPKHVNAGSRTKDAKDRDSLCERNVADKCPPAQPTNKHTPEEKQPRSSVFFAKDHERDGVGPNREQARMNGAVSSRIPGAAEDLGREVLCRQGASVSEAGEQHGSGDEREVECEETQRGNGGGDEDEQATSDYDAEADVGREVRTSSAYGRTSLSEEEQPEVACQAACTGSNSSVDESTCDPDVDDPSSEEEQPEVEGMRLKVIIEEGVLGSEEEEEGHFDYLQDQMEQARKYRESKTLIEETEEDNVSSNEEEHDADESYIERDTSHFIKSQDSYTQNDRSSCIKTDILTKMYGLNEDEDSGNDHSGCEEHAEMEQPEFEDKTLNTSSYEDKESSEQERIDIDGHTENNCTEYQAVPPHSKDTRCEKVVEILMHQTEEITSQSVAERVILLEKQVAQKTTESSALRRSTQRKAPLGPDEEDSPPEPAAPRSAPQSSLSFSYDSSGVVTSEPEGHRVRSIREMFLAKTAADVQHSRPPGSNASEARAETSVSGGYQSQTSSELSSGEDDSARKSITKGFVRRTIERLYGRKDAGPDQEAGGRPPSAPKQKKKEHPSAFSPFHMARCKAMSEFSYFNSTHAVDPLGEATRCVAFNAELRPEDRVSADGERWLLRENALIRKSVSEPVAINKGFTKSQGGGMREDAEEDPPYSLFSTRSELQDSQSSLSRKCTYFSLPHTSDSDAHLDEPSTVSRSSAEGPSAADAEAGHSGDAGTRAERSGAPPGAAAEPKRKGNKVHPATEPPPDGEVVLVQPGKGRGVVSTRAEEPDVLDMLYNFCGQNCPIL